MAISRVGSAPTVARAATSTVSPTWASGQSRTANDLLWGVAWATGSNAITSSDGTWTKILEQTASSSGKRLAVFYKYAAGGDTAPSFSSTSATKMQAFLDEFTGNDTTGPFYTGSASAASGSNLTATLTQAPGVDGVALSGYGIHCSSATATETPDTSWTQDAFYTASDNAHAGGDYYISPPTGSATSEKVTIGTATPDAFAVIVTFFKASGGAAARLPPPVFARQAPFRASSW